MKKIPLESTIVGSYGFLFRNIVSIIGTVWLPILLIAVLLGAYLCQLIPHEWLQGRFPDHLPEHIDKGEVKEYLISHLPVAVAGFFVLFLAGLLARGMISVGILRHAIGEKTKTTFVYFSLGARVWKMVAVTLLFFVVYFALEVAAMIVIAGASFSLEMMPFIPGVVTDMAEAVLGLAVVVAFVYIVARLFFFLPAVVVAENRLSPSRAWQLGEGNVWRIILLLLAVLMPVCIIAGVAVVSTVFATIVPEAMRQQPNTPDEALAFLKSILPVLPILGGIYLVVGIAMMGLVFGAMGNAYKAVAASEETRA